MSNFPFIQTRQNEVIIREFISSVSSDELVWHRDRENRSVKVKSGEGWQLQIENKLPFDLEAGRKYYIPRNTYHRVIKGHDNLVVEIREIK